MAAGVGAVAKVPPDAVAGAVEPENTVWPEDDVTLLGAVLLGAVRLALPALSPPPPDVLPPGRAGGFVRSPEAGASLRATLGVLNAGAVLDVFTAGADEAGVLAAGAGAGAATENEAGAKPPVGRDASTV